MNHRHHQRKIGGVFTSVVGNKTYQFTRSSSIPGDLNAGFADIGFVGSDKIDEAQLGGRWSNMASASIPSAECWMVLAAKTPFCELGELRIATSYPNLTSEWLMRKPEEISAKDARVVLETSGATEGYFGVNGTNSIVDIREKGKTLYDNGYSSAEEIEPIKTKMIWRIGREEPVLSLNGLCGALNRIQGRNLSGTTETTTGLLLKDRNELVKKLGSEMSEFIADLASGSDNGLVDEAQDVIYALSIALESRNKSLIEALNKL